LEKLWVSDGTSAGTVVFKQICPYYNPASNIHLMTQVGNSLFFVANDGTHGEELWITDGTDAGTKMVKDIDTIPGSGSMDFTSSFAVLNNKIYFVASESVHGSEIWMSDGTASGTQLLKDINPGSGDAFSYPNDLTVLNNDLFFHANDGVNGSELWMSDGTGSGTHMVKDINPGAASSGIQEIVPFNGKVYFQADNGITGNELWLSDGTLAGTQLIKDINPGSNYSDAKYFTPYAGKLYFSAYTNADGEQLWVTDGTTAGTMKAKDVLAGSLSGIYKPMVFNGRLYFTAFTASYGRQLFQFSASSDSVSVISPATMVVDAAAPGGYPSYYSILGGIFYYPAVYDVSKGIEFYKLITTPGGIGTLAKGRGFQLYPNPADNFLTLETDGNISVLRILNQLGQLVFQSFLNDRRSITLDCSSYANGIYLAEFNLDQRTITQKFIVRH
jgi:ELWxxDGT repeat protein